MTLMRVPALLLSVPGKLFLISSGAFQIFLVFFGVKQWVSVTIWNPAFCLSLYLTSALFQDKLQHVGDVSEQKIKCRSIGGVRLSEALYEKVNW